MRISNSMKRATIVFNIPQFGRVSVQEEAGKVDLELRRCIRVASEVFFRELNKSESGASALGLTTETKELDETAI